MLGPIAAAIFGVSAGYLAREPIARALHAVADRIAPKQEPSPPNPPNPALPTPPTPAVDRVCILRGKRIPPGVAIKGLPPQYVGHQVMVVYEDGSGEFAPAKGKATLPNAGPGTFVYPPDGGNMTDVVKYVPCPPDKSVWLGGELGLSPAPNVAPPLTVGLPKPASPPEPIWLGEPAPRAAEPIWIGEPSPGAPKPCCDSCAHGGSCSRA